MRFVEMEWYSSSSNPTACEASSEIIDLGILPLSAHGSLARNIPHAKRMNILHSTPNPLLTLFHDSVSVELIGGRYT